MLFRVLGAVDVVVDDGVRSPGGGRGRALLAALLMRAGDVVTVDQLADAMWQDAPPSNPGGAVHTVVARLRRALGPAGAALVTRPGGYSLVLGGAHLDADLFVERCRTARGRARDDPAAAVALFDRALDLWTGPPYLEFGDTFAQAAAARLVELRRTAAVDRTEALLLAGATAEAVAAAADLARADPLAERPAAVLMQALSSDGRTAEALAAYRRHADALRDELGLDPPAGLRELHTRILREGVPQRPQPAPAARLSALPVRPSPVIGREAELATLLTILEAPRLTTIVGPGGVGKTRVALELAHRARAAGAEVWWADLVPVPPAGVLGSVAAASGVEIPSDADPLDALCTALAARHGLLVLDNAEHVLHPVAELAERLRDAAPGLALLVTSRERLVLDSENTQRLAPLPLPDGPDRHNAAVRLFLERATGLGEPDRAALGLVATVCRRLDGLPLAIELGAARAGGLGLAVLAERLDDRLDVLGGGRRTAHRRHRTLRAVVDWSHDLLTPEEATLFRRLGVFPAPFTLDQAEAVCAVDLPARTVAGLLSRLVDQSLVQGSGDGRFRLLETLRASAAERLADADETLTLAARHARDTAERLAVTSTRLWGAEEGVAVQVLTSLTPDLHAAWAHAREHDVPLALRLAGDVYDFAYFRQRLDLLRWGLQVTEWPIDDPGSAAALGTAAAALWSAGRLGAAADVAERGITAAGGPDSTAAALPTEVSADIAMFLGRTDLATERYRRHAVLRRARDEPVHAVMAELAVAHALVNAGRVDEASAVLADAVPPALRSATPTALAWAYYLLGEVAAHEDPGLAADCYRSAVEHGLRADSRLFVSLARTSAAALTARTGALHDALARFPVVLDEWVGIGNLSAAWWAVQHVVVLLVDLGEHTDAAVLAGAVDARKHALPDFTGDAERLQAAGSSIRERLGDAATDSALAHGAALADADVLARAHAALAAAVDLVRTQDRRPLPVEEPPVPTVGTTGRGPAPP